jgi:hypothetical protein
MEFLNRNLPNKKNPLLDTEWQTHQQHLDIDIALCTSEGKMVLNVCDVDTLQSFLFISSLSFFVLTFK